MNHCFIVEARRLAQSLGTQRLSDFTRKWLAKVDCEELSVDDLDDICDVLKPGLDYDFFTCLSITARLTP